MTADLRTLRREWYAKLAKEGFEDIETLTRSGNLYSVINKKRARGINPEAALLKAEYYRRASHFLHDHPWKSPFERKLWEMHTDGATYREIAEQNGISLRRAFGTLKALIEGPFKDYRGGEDIDPDDEPPPEPIGKQKACPLKKAEPRPVETPKAPSTQKPLHGLKSSKPHPKTLSPSSKKTPLTLWDTLQLCFPLSMATSNAR